MIVIETFARGWEPKYRPTPPAATLSQHRPSSHRCAAFNSRRATNPVALPADRSFKPTHATMVRHKPIAAGVQKPAQTRKSLRSFGHVVGLGEQRGRHAALPFVAADDGIAAVEAVDCFEPGLVQNSTINRCEAPDSRARQTQDGGPIGSSQSAPA